MITYITLCALTFILLFYNSLYNSLFVLFSEAATRGVLRNFAKFTGTYLHIWGQHSNAYNSYIVGKEVLSGLMLS